MSRRPIDWRSRLAGLSAFAAAILLGAFIATLRTPAPPAPPEIILIEVTHGEH